jgi:predicted glycoside hydrolase/deacetylase ChbG (UPF0249 family)
VAVLASAITVEKILPRRPERLVIIHSDDAGMYPSVNQATIDAMERGYVSSCSILAACPAFEEFAAYARSHPGGDFGVHLDLTCEKETDRWGPVLGPKRVPSLADQGGFFWRTTRQAAEHAKIAEVEAELRAQIERCRDSGIKLSHLDHHMFILFKRPDLIRLYVRLGLEYGLAIRYSLAAPAPDDLDPADQECVKAYKEGLEALRAHRMPLCAVSDMDNYQVPPEKKRQYYFDLFQTLQPGVTEIIIHCAYGPPGPLHPPAVERREADTRVFMSQETADMLQARGIHVITWKQFREMTAK